MRIVLGSTVVAGNDNIGTVRAVAYNPETSILSHIIVARGLFKSDTSIPLRAVDIANANDNGGQVQVQSENGGVIGMRDFKRDRYSDDGPTLTNPTNNLVVPPTPAIVSGTGLPATLQMPGTIQPTSTTAVGTAGDAATHTADSEANDRIPSIRDNAMSADTDSSPDSFSGAGTSAADNSARSDVLDSSMTGSDDVPLGSFYIWENARVRDIGHDKVGTVQAVTYRDSTSFALESLIVKGEGNLSDTLVIPAAWLGSVTEDDKNITLKRSVEEFTQTGHGEFAGAASDARQSALAVEDHPLDHGVERTGKARGGYDTRDQAARFTTSQSELETTDRALESTGSSAARDISAAGSSTPQSPRPMSGERDLEGREVVNADDFLDNRRNQPNTGV